MKTLPKSSRNSRAKQPSKINTRSSDKSISAPPKKTKNATNTTATQPKSPGISAKNKSSSPKRPASNPPSKAKAPTSVKATRNTSQAAQSRNTNRSRSSSPKSKSSSRVNTSKVSNKSETQKTQTKKPATKNQTAQNTTKGKKAATSKTPQRSANPSPKRSESPKKAAQKGQAANKPKTVQDKAAMQAKQPNKKAKEAKEVKETKETKETEARPQSRIQTRAKSPKASPAAKGKASPVKSRDQSKKAAPKAVPKAAASKTSPRKAQNAAVEQIQHIDLSVPDPVTGLVRDAEGHLVEKMTETDKELTLRMNLDAILEDDDNYEIAIKMVNLEEPTTTTRPMKPHVSARTNVRRMEEEKEEVEPEEEEEETYELKEYSLFEDWRLLEAADAYRAIYGPRGLHSKKQWGKMIDPATGELLFGGRRTNKSIIGRYLGCIAHLNEAEQRMIEELGNTLPIERMKRLRGLYSKASGQTRLIGIHELVYEGPEQRMWLNPSRKMDEPVSLDEFAKRSIEKKAKEDIKHEQRMERRRGREEDEEDEEDEWIVSSGKEKLRNHLLRDEKDEFRAIRMTRSPDKGRSEGKASVTRRSEGKLSVNKNEEDEEKITMKLLMEQKRYLNQKRLAALKPAVRGSEEEDEEMESQRKILKTNAGREIGKQNVQKENKEEDRRQNKPANDRLTKAEKLRLKEQERKERLQRKEEKELKLLKDISIYETNSCSLTERFGSRKSYGEVKIDPSLAMYVDFESGFRQFVRESDNKEVQRGGNDRNIKWARLSKYAKEYDLPLPEVISLFNRVSCDTQDLELVLKGGDKGILWTDQEDMDLLNNNQIAMRYLVKFKGPIRIKRRRDFLSRVA